MAINKATNNTNKLTLTYEIEVLSPFFVLKEPGQGFGGNQVMLYNGKLYFIQSKLIKENAFWENLHKQLEQLVQNKNYQAIYSTYNTQLWQYFKNHPELLNKLQSINLEFTNNNSLPDLNKPTITVESLHYIYSPAANEYQFYLPGSSIKGIFCRIAEIANKELPNLNLQLLFGASNNKNNLLNNSLFIFEDIAIPPESLAVFEIQRMRNPYNPKTGEAKNNFKRYIIGIKPGTPLKGRIKISIAKLRIYGEQAVSQYMNFIQQWAQLAKIINQKIHDFYLKNSWEWIRKQWNLSILNTQKDMEASELIFQAGFGSTKMLKVNPEEYNKSKDKSSKNKKYHDCRHDLTNKQTSQKSLPPTTTQYMDLKTKQPVGFIKIKLSPSNE